ncbi:tRNA lysidine(34) synthetase TilS [Salinibacterium sp. NK8237]|uniref:tRNA lysidine(34) synthetase TilS n=1 Tax=Salinibacterium sp. NK8237 TaxID=2792038 RepID=UPI0018CEB516|nr:tRNA lysidine(34) synthetase TilS [Salinibacterium sp. NK8237]MBH0130075.1 tRNA lysidine(34) synthetase TilS [Salinibacterium sp. NK8237]
MHSDRRPRLTPAIADVRRAVRTALASLPSTSGSEPLVLVALSGGPDSLALAAATAFEASKAGLRAGAVIVNHNLQDGSADVAAAAAQKARDLGLDPVDIRSVLVGDAGGPESAARDARYAALAEAAAEHGAIRVLLGHTLDDQAETVLLGLARGSGAGSLKGMAVDTGQYLRPLLAVPRTTTVQCCEDSGIVPWNDPHNLDTSYTRVRVRQTVLPLLESELGPGIRDALVRTADQAREDAEALDHFAEEIAEDLAEISEAGISLPVRALAANPAALRQRLIRLAVASEFHVSLSRTHTLEIARLVTDWRGQGPIDVPGVRVERRENLLHFSAHSEERDAV